MSKRELLKALADCTHYGTQSIEDFNAGKSFPINDAMDEPVVIILCDPSIGPSATANITAVCCGIDWDAGKIFLQLDKEVQSAHIADYYKKQVK